MRNDPSKNGGESAQAESTVAGDSQHLWKLRALGLWERHGGGSSEIHRVAHLSHATVLAVTSATSGQGRLARREEGRCHGQAHHNRQ
jgi:hypothetical protein